MKYEITPAKGLVHLDLPEIWRFRDLIYIFVWRDIKVRYKQTAVGVAWALFQPFINMIIFSVFFGSLAKIGSDGIPYPIFVFTGLLLWNYFSTSLSNVSNCLVENENIIRKVYFPRLVLPIATSITPIVDFVIALIIMIGLALYYHYSPNLLGVLMLPILVLISQISSSGLGLFLASVNAKFRDVRYVLPFFIQIMFFITPVIYPVSIIPARFQWIIFLNPMAGIISFARTSLLGSGANNWGSLGISLAMSLVLMLIGIVYFRKTERFFADVL